MRIAAEKLRLAGPMAMAPPVFVYLSTLNENDSRTLYGSDRSSIGVIPSPPPPPSGPVITLSPPS